MTTPKHPVGTVLYGLSPACGEATPEVVAVVATVIRHTPTGRHVLTSGHRLTPEGEPYGEGGPARWIRGASSVEHITDVEALEGLDRARSLGLAVATGRGARAAAHAFTRAGYLLDRSAGAGG